jgi:hypothetical protein
MTVRALRRIAELVAAGAVVVGRRPAASPSLADDGAEHQRLCDLLWAAGPAGRGRVIDTSDLAAALDQLGVEPALTVEGPDLLRIGRRIGNDEIVFLANPQPETATATVRASSGATLVAWDPVSLRREALPELPDDGTQGRRYRLLLPPAGSVFLVPGGPADLSQQATGTVDLDGTWQLALPGVPAVGTIDGPRPWTELGPAAAGFSGVGTYRTVVDLDGGLLDGCNVVLSVAEVGDVGRVRVNGTVCGVLWTEPYRLDVSAALRAGSNTVEIDVANAWMNRLIAESADPSGGIFAPVAGVYAKDATPSPSGLIGPVRLHFSR